MECPVRLKLEKKCQDARATLDQAVKTLRERIGISPLEEFKRLNARMGAAWYFLERVQRELEQHVDEHCCLSHGSKLPV